MACYVACCQHLTEYRSRCFPFVKIYSNFSPKLRASFRTKSFSVEKNAIFEAFRNALGNRWLRDYLSVTVQFTKNEFARA